MKKNLRSKILLCVLAGGVLATNTALAAEYNVSVEGKNDNYNESGIRNYIGNAYEYNFNTDDVLNLNNSAYAIKMTESDVTYQFTNRLNINMQNNDDSQAYGITISGIVIDNGYINTTIDRSEGGNITLTGEFNNGWGILSGVSMQNTSGNGNNVIKLGNGNITVSNSYQTSNANGAYAYGINFDGVSTDYNDKVFMGDGIIDVTAYVEGGSDSYAEAAGIDFSYSSQGGYVELGNNTINAKAIINDDGSATLAKGISLYHEYGDAEIVGNDVSINVLAQGGYDTDAVGIYAEPYEGSAVISIGEGDITVVANNNDSNANVYSHGIIARDGATVNKESGKITAKANGGATTEVYGVRADSWYGDEAIINLGTVDVSAEAVNDGNNDISVYGIYAEGDKAEVNMQGGSITAQINNADGVTDDNNNDSYAIYGYDSSVVNINQGTTNKVVINGDIRTGRNAAVNLNLNTADSVFTGGIEDDNGTLNLANDARWIATGYSEVNNLTMNQGNIYVETPRFIGDIKINNYSGMGNILFKADDTDNEGLVNINTGSVIITDAAEGSFINVGISNNSINTLDISKTDENLNTLAGKVYYDSNNNNLNGKVTIKEGLITPEASGDLLFDSANNNRGYVTNITGGNRVTATMDAMKNLAATAIVAWRQEDSTLIQRLGELRESDGGQGIWVRMSRGEFEYDGEYKNQYNFFQLGYDWAAGNWHYGAAVSHNDGQTTYTHGDGENRSTSLSLYGTWLGDKGHYADIVLKQGRLSNDFDIYTEAGHTSGDYDAWGTSLSGEYGMKVELNDGWFITPQAQLTLMRIGGEDYTTNNGIKVHQESLESAVGRIGFEVGKRISNSGSIYAKASLLHDFAGSADTYLSLNGLTNSYRQDIGDTWWEAGLGMNFKTSDNSYVYADLVKTFGGDVETPWQWNAGMRWTF